MPSLASEAAPALAFAPTAETLEAAIALLERTADESGGAVDPARRREALACYAELPTPGARPNRSWKHDYAKLRWDGLRWSSGRGLLPTAPLDEAADPDTDRPALATQNVAGLVHLGATYLATGTPAARDPRIVVLPLADARRTHPDLVARAAHGVADWRADRFAALATAFQNCGAFVYVPAGVVLDEPIQLVWSNAEPLADAVFARIVVVLGDGARATVLERHVGGGEPFICGVVETHTGANAQLDYVAVQQAGDGARIFMHRAARCEAGAVVRWHLAELGGALARSVIDAALDAPGARAETSALFFNTANQHVDLTTGTVHTVGDTQSDTVVRSAATDRGQGRYYGNIMIRAKAHGSDASLRDDALLLSRHAHIDSVPALEISANDVRAFHGATVGSLDEDALFYAGSRGIPRAEALRLIALGFFEPVVSRFPGEALRDEIRTALDQKIDDATEFEA